MMKNKRIQGLFLAIICTLSLQIRALEPEILDRVTQEREALKNELLEEQQAVTRKQVLLGVGGAITALASGAYAFNAMQEHESSLDGRKLAQSIIKIGVSAVGIVAGLAGIGVATESLIATNKDKSLSPWRESNGLRQAICGIGGQATMCASAGWFLHTLLDENLSLASIPSLIVAAGTGTLGGVAILGAILQQCTPERW